MESQGAAEAYFREMVTGRGYSQEQLSYESEKFRFAVDNLIGARKVFVIDDNGKKVLHGIHG